mmetsp:Transcript_1502/g.2288  ORF Transcript_1502/g.2288 Transcript_1502/m.2288 type:complete len:92 (-) Transcript_1502:335-610(-)
MSLNRSEVIGRYRQKRTRRCFDRVIYKKMQKANYNRPRYMGRFVSPVIVDALKLECDVTIRPTPVEIYQINSADIFTDLESDLIQAVSLFI